MTASSAVTMPRPSRVRPGRVAALGRHPLDRGLGLSRKPENEWITIRMNLSSTCLHLAVGDDGQQHARDRHGGDDADRPLRTHHAALVWGRASTVPSGAESASTTGTTGSPIVACCCRSCSSSSPHLASGAASARMHRESHDARANRAAPRKSVDSASPPRPPVDIWYSRRSTSSGAWQAQGAGTRPFSPGRGRVRRPRWARPRAAGTRE